MRRIYWEEREELYLKEWEEYIEKKEKNYI